jgi:signal peptidase
MDEQIQNNPIKSKIKNTITAISLILAVLLCLYVAIQVMTVGHASIFGFSLFRVVTGSMEPQIPVGALLMCQDVDIETIVVDDIVCFYSKDTFMQGKVITHRVVQILTEADGQILLLTKGDANAVADIQYVTSENLIGKVIYHAGRGDLLSGVLSFLTSKVGFLACIVFPCLILAIVILKDSVKNIRSELNHIMTEMDEEEKHQKQLKEAAMTEEEYAQLAAQIRAELTEELKQGGEGPQDN